MGSRGLKQFILLEEQVFEIFSHKVVKVYFDIIIPGVKITFMAPIVPKWVVGVFSIECMSII